MIKNNSLRFYSVLLKYKNNFFVLILYSILTLFMTYPVGFNNDYVPGIGDVFSHLWYFWWFKSAILSGINPFFTENMFYPGGVSLIFSMEPGNAILLLPLQLIFGLIVSYKILYLFTFIASGYGTYLLVKYITGDARAAFISGMIFMFSPYHFAHALGHTNLMSLEWIPFYILFLFKIVKEDNSMNGIYAGIFLFLTSISSYYYLVYLIFFTMIFLLYSLLLNRQEILKRKTRRGLLLLVVIYFLLFSPFIYLIIKENPFDSSRNIYIGGFDTYSADILGFFIPSQLHPFFKEIVTRIYDNFTGNIAEHTVFVGYSVLLMAIIAFLKIKTREVKFWTFSALVFFILSLGPTLHINGKSYIELPYAILMKIPIFSMARVPSRWDVLLMLSFAVLAGYGVSHISKKYEGRILNKISKKNIITVVISCIILFEFLSLPYPVSSTKVPEFYYELKSDPENYAILEVPYIFTSSSSLYFQTVHEKKLVNGYVSRTPDNSIQFIVSTPVVQELFNYTENGPIYNDILNQDTYKVGRSILNYYNIQYIIIHTDYIKHKYITYKEKYGDERQNMLMNKFLQKTLHEEPKIYLEDNLIVYPVKKNSSEPFMMLREGWHGLEQWNYIPTRWTSNNATIFYQNSLNNNVDLSFTVMSFNEPRHLQIYLNNELIYEKEVRENFSEISTSLKINKGINLIKFYSKDGCQKPSDISEKKSSDTRCLSFAIQNISLGYH